MSDAVLRLSPEDNVVVALRRLEPGEEVHVGDLAVAVRDAIPFAHKLAIADIALGGTLKKFGVPIGSTTRPVVAGEHVHVHNIKSDYIVNAEDFYEGEA